MEVTVTIVADETELGTLNEVIEFIDESLENQPEVEVPDEEDDSSPELELSEERRYVLEALQRSPRSALRLVHRKATELEGSPFDDYAQSDGWNDERRNVREILWSMKSEGLVANDGQLWYPTDKAPSNL